MLGIADRVGRKGGQISACIDLETYILKMKTVDKHINSIVICVTRSENNMIENKLTAWKHAVHRVAREILLVDKISRWRKLVWDTLGILGLLILKYAY